MTVKFAVTQGAAPTTAGTQSFTKSGFGTPKAAMFFISRATANGTSVNDAAIGCGWTIGSGGTDYSTSIQSEHDASPTNADRSQQDLHCVHILDTAGAIEGEADWDAWITDGVRIDWTDAPSSAYLVTCVLIGGTDVTVNSGRSNIGASTNIAHGLSETPDLIFLAGTSGSPNGISTTASFSFGVVCNNDGTIEESVITGISTNAGGDDNYNGFWDNRCASFLSGSGSISRDFSLTAWDSTNFTLTRQTGTAGADPQWLAIGFGSATNKLDRVLFDSSTTTGTLDINNDDSFTSQFGIILAAGSHTSDLDLNPHNELMIGVFDEDAEYSVSIVDEKDSGVIADALSITDNRVWHGLQEDETSAGVGYIHSGSGAIDSTGIIIDYTTADNVARKSSVTMIEEDTGGGSDAPALIHSMKQQV